MEDMAHGRYGTWEIWNMGDIRTLAILYMGDIEQVRYGSWRYCTWVIWYMKDMVHGRYDTCEIWYTGDMLHGRYGT